MFEDVLPRAIRLGLLGAAVLQRDGAGTNVDDERASLADLTSTAMRRSRVE